MASLGWVAVAAGVCLATVLVVYVALRVLDSGLDFSWLRE